ncbi:hypothetical protein D915_005083 [Fasciola hepatica]|uniref:Uncharacterized protein n=1 Tax=Fasciola hepatica TaxID=6192 RepID=A0A4E0S117_FASHE|nr:hypothetical protein D915_005083 [Fasciola hepatica]
MNRYPTYCMLLSACLILSTTWTTPTVLSSPVDRILEESAVDLSEPDYAVRYPSPRRLFKSLRTFGRNSGPWVQIPSESGDVLLEPRRRRFFCNPTGCV